MRLFGNRVVVRWSPDMLNRPYVNYDEEQFAWVALMYGNTWSDPVMLVEVPLPYWLRQRLLRRSIERDLGAEEATAFAVARAELRRRA